MKKSQGLLQPEVLAFGAVMLSSSLLNNVFVSFYITFYVSRVPKSMFYVAQVVFMIWNSTNDPLFGWFSDRMKSENALGRRLKAIGIGGPLWALAFLTTWFPFGDGVMSGIQFMFVLCFYDGLLTYVEVNHQALLAEITTNDIQRKRYAAASNIFAAAGALSSFIANVVWDPEKLFGFRLFSVILALSATAVFIHASSTLRKIPKRDSSQGMIAMDSEDEDTNKKNAAVPFSTVLQQIITNKNFLVFVGIGFLQSFDCTFQKNFLAMFMDRLLSESVPQFVRSLAISSGFVLPHILTVLLTTFLHHKGIAWHLDMLFNVRLFIACISFFIPLSAPFTIMTFMVLNRVASESVCRSFPLVTSDLIDEDIVTNKRSSSYAASLIGSANFFSKASQSIAPMFAYAILFSRSDTMDEDLTDGPIESDSSAHGDVTVDNLFLLRFIGAVPFVIVGIQKLLWGQWTLKGKYLDKVRGLRKDVSDNI
eukprot:TRINITY_DN7560_c0_g1_i1.p1 TRINITY_DN7560_c0_g1~~TRINITY_DN7560_c0_g1_i1.p1  ORF type:complete len:480 (+),score=85.54 TRINITY_DN7560_c0_g1_i1:46-1485(+)